MVILHIKRDDESLFLYETTLTCLVEDVVESVDKIHNGCLKLLRICTEMEQLRDFGIAKPPEMYGLLEDQIKDLKLIDEFGDKCIPSGSFEEKDPLGKRNGRCPKVELQHVFDQTIMEVQRMISKEQVKSGICLTPQHIQDAMDILQGAVKAVYPELIPSFDPIRMELENREDIRGTRDEKWVLHPATTEAWFAGKKLETGKKLSHYFGNNEKTKVIIKLQPQDSGNPGREPQLTDEERKAMLMAEFKRREELKKLQENENHSFLDCEWADNHHLKKSFLGLNTISWKPCH